jgi:hypothetical protein
MIFTRASAADSRRRHASSKSASQSSPMSRHLPRVVGSSRGLSNCTQGVRASCLAVIVATVLTACGGDDPSIDVDAGVARHLAITDQTIEDFEGRCSEFDEGEELCGEEFLRRAIEDDCHNDVDDATDRASRAVLQSADPDIARIQIEVMSVACPEIAAEWIAYELGSG